jgi:hypothetical protein
MKHNIWLAALALGVLAAPGAAASEQAPAQKEARIPFANHGGIRDWHAEDSDTLYVQDRMRRWYRAELMHRVTGLPFAWAIGFDVGGIDTFDRFSSIVVEGQRIPVRSLVRVEGPPPKSAAQRSITQG